MEEMKFEVAVGKSARFTGRLTQEAARGFNRATIQMGSIGEPLAQFVRHYGDHCACRCRGERITNINVEQGNMDVRLNIEAETRWAEKTNLKKQPAPVVLDEKLFWDEHASNLTMSEAKLDEAGKRLSVIAIKRA